MAGTTMNALGRRVFLLFGLAAASSGLAACGGGGGSGDAGGTPPPSPPPPPPPPPPPGVSFTEVSVHDPSVVVVDGTTYVFGSHLAAAKTTDLMNWSLVAEGVNAANPLFDDVTTELAETFAWSQVTSLWAPDVVRLDDGRFYMYYCSCKGDSPRSALGVAVADAIEGPYVDKQILLKSGMWGQVSEDGVNVYDARVHPNAVDPQVFFDQAGTLWMVYGSYSGGIFILEMDPATGLQKPGQGYGRHLMGGNHARIEGAYILYSPASAWYYLFVSFGGLDAAGGYNLRVARSRTADGPYVDAAGTDMATVKADPDLPLFDDASIAPHGQKLFGSHQFALAEGETGTAPGYVSPGHNSAFVDAGTGQHFIVFHSRFPGRGEQHEVRVHQMHINADGWPVVAPLRHVPLAVQTPAPSAVVTLDEAAGAYKLVDHGKDISATVKASQALRLEAGGSVSGAASGSWSHGGDNRVTLTLAGVAYAGVLSRQWSPNSEAFVVTFSAQSAAGVSLWGIRTGA